MPLQILVPQYKLLAKSDLVTTGTPASVGPQGSLIFEYAKYLHVEGTLAGGTFPRLRPNATSGAAAHLQCNSNVVESSNAVTNTSLTNVTTGLGGWPLTRVTTSGTPLWFNVDIYNAPTIAKRMTGWAMSGSIVVGTPPVNIRTVGIWQNAGVIQYLDLYTVTTFTGTTAGTFSGAATATSTAGPIEFHVWGKLDS
jgi:hypothetical protein